HNRAPAWPASAPVSRRQTPHGAGAAAVSARAQRAPQGQAPPRRPRAPIRGRPMGRGLPAYPVSPALGVGRSLLVVQTSPCNEHTSCGTNVAAAQEAKGEHARACSGANPRLCLGRGSSLRRPRVYFLALAPGRGTAQQEDEIDLAGILDPEPVTGRDQHRIPRRDQELLLAAGCRGVKVEGAHATEKY